MNNIEKKIEAVKRNFISEDGFDLCVACGTKTEYKTSTPVDIRKGYVEGAGQLCLGCDDILYGGNKK
ncbi:MAG: hypothetical protein V1660_03355 [archaeon]